MAKLRFREELIIVRHTNKVQLTTVGSEDDMNITSRDIKVALVTLIVTLCIAALAQQAPVLHSKVFDWDGMTAKPTDKGFYRSVYRGPTATLDELEIHMTTLNPGQISHPPHKHGNEELVIIKEGTVETLSNGQWVKAGPGSIIFEASNELHSLKNIGPGPTTYHVINWTTDKTPKSPAP